MRDNHDSRVEKLAKLGAVQITGFIDKGTVDELARVMLDFFLERRELILVLIFSNGGLLRPALEIFDLLRLFPGRKIGLVFGKAYSAASIILQACDKRYATPNSSILIHHGRCNEVNLDMLHSEDKLNAFLKEERELSEHTYSIFVNRTGKSRDEICSLCLRNTPIFVKEAIEFGLIDEVWDKPLPFKPEEMFPKK